MEWTADAKQTFGNKRGKQGKDRREVQRSLGATEGSTRDLPEGTSMKERPKGIEERPPLEGGFGGKPLKKFFAKFFKFSPKIFTRNFNSLFIHRILTRNFFSENL